MATGEAVKPLADLNASAAALSDCASWRELSTHAESARGAHLRDLLDGAGRYEDFSRRACGIRLDFSRNVMTRDTLRLLLQLAEERDLGHWIAQMFAGGRINNTEDRPALHAALRRPADQPIVVDGEDVMPLVHRELDKFLAFAEAVRVGSRVGATGQRFTDVVNIGIGGSDLGLVMLDAALARFRDPHIRTHFASNIDGSQLADVLDRVDPATTMFVICSKSFTTLETQLNADAARAWFVERMEADAIGAHFAAISTNADAMDTFGLANDARFEMWDWVGGRYSLWSAIGLSVAIAIGADNFREFLAGGHAMDEHFRTAPLADNLPALLGLIGVWNQNFLGCRSHAVLPYDQRLRYFPAFLQQLDMESNGKGVARDGSPVPCETGTVIWGEPGSNAQHSFFQLLHQGTAPGSLDFIAPARASSRLQQSHEAGLANMLAQAEAFARGFSEDEARTALLAAGRSGEDADRLAPHKVHRGNRPSNLIVFAELAPRTLGALIALYEQKVFTQSVIWGINPFDQWGVELGKVMATEFSAALAAGRVEELPGAAQELLESGRD